MVFKIQMNLVLQNVSVRLLDCNSNLIAETLTDSEGEYLFVDLLPGDYMICSDFNNSDYIPTIANSGNGELDSNIADASINTCSECFTLEPNVDRSDIDFGYIRKQSSITINIWEDVNYNATNDSENPMPSIVVTLYDCNGQLLRTSNSDINGVVVFDQLYLEEFYIEVTLENDLIIHPNGIFSDANGLNTTDCFLLEEAGTSIGVPVVRFSSVGNFVWHDENRNGVIDNGEPGIPNLFISLTDCNGVLVSQTRTDDNGNYTFEDIAPGDYMICTDDPGNFYEPTIFFGSDDSVNSDFDLGNGTLCSACFSVTAFSDNSDIDFGFIREVTEINIEVWFDDDGDGRFDAGENASVGTTVTLFDCNGIEVASAISDANGIVSFVDIGLGDYYIQAEEIAGLDFSNNTSITGDNGTATSDCFTVDSSGAELEIGYVGPSTIGDFVWLDINDNGRQDTDEPGVEGITLNLINSAGVTQQTVTSDANGNYLFEDLAPDAYRIILVGLSSDYTLTRSGQASDDLDSDFEQTNTLIATPILNLLSNQIDLDIDLGLLPAPIQINGVVWNDGNGNMLNDSESGLGDVIIELYSCSGDLIQETTSGNNGEFVFEDVMVGDYYIQANEVNDFQFFTGGDSQITNTNGDNSTDCFNVDGTTSISIMIGATPMSNMRTQVFIDDNGNGLLEASDTGLSNVSVVLRDLNDVAMDMQTTNNQGEVSFENIYPGMYKLELLDVETGLAPTLEGQGTEDVDSDLILDGDRLLTEAIGIFDGIERNDVDLGLVWLTSGKVAGNIWRDSNGDFQK